MIERRAVSAPPWEASSVPSAIERMFAATELDRLDELLLERIAAGATAFPEIYSPEVIQESGLIAAANGACFTNMNSGFRVVETRLQYLKWCGRIVFKTGRGWRIAAKHAPITS